VPLLDLVERRQLLTDRLPELVAQASTLPDGCALDGELLVWPANHALPSSLQQLQARMARKTLSKTLLADAPVVFIAYDLLQRDGLDLRERPLHERREQLEDLLQGHALRLSPLLLADDGRLRGRCVRRHASAALGSDAQAA
jgi:DNA ligase-1